MTQVTTGIRRILSHSSVYDAFQSLVGGAAARRRICAEYFRATPGMTIVDVGCGTAEILDYLPTGVRYFGFDLAQEYIDTAMARFGTRGIFRCQDITLLGANEIPPCDLAIAFGVLHHLDDDGARALLENLYERLAPGGRMVTIDPALEEGQAWLARALIRRDRGQNVRKGSDYLALTPDRFSEKLLTLRHDLLRIPYSHAILECTKS
jgi:SAM-dependent methyltransferase